MYKIIRQKLYIDDDGSVVRPKQSKIKNYFSPYHESYGNRSYHISKDYKENMIIPRTYSGKKRKATGFVYLKYFPYRDA